VKDLRVFGESVLRLVNLYSRSIGHLWQRALGCMSCGFELCRLTFVACSEIENNEKHKSRKVVHRWRCNLDTTLQANTRVSWYNVYIYIYIYIYTSIYKNVTVHLCVCAQTVHKNT
jgi:hypothetical protein